MLVAHQMRYYFFSITISYHDFLQHYSGFASRVIVVTEQGLTLQLPAEHFRSFLTHSGVTGRFRLVTTIENKFVRLERVG